MESQKVCLYIDIFYLYLKMKNFQFNKIYVIESLGPEELHIGKKLYDD